MIRNPDLVIKPDHPPPVPERKVVVVNIRREFADELETLQELGYPTLNPAEHIRAVHYRKHVEVFPEGQFMALWGKKVLVLPAASAPV